MLCEACEIVELEEKTMIIITVNWWSTLCKERVEEKMRICRACKEKMLVAMDW